MAYEPPTLNPEADLSALLCTSLKDAPVECTVMHDGLSTLNPEADLSDLLCTPLRGAPVEGPALVNHKVHGAHCLLNGSEHIRSVAEDQVNVVQLQALQSSLKQQEMGIEPALLSQVPACTQCGHNKFARQAQGAWAAVHQCLKKAESVIDGVE